MNEKVAWLVAIIAIACSAGVIVESNQRTQTFKKNEIALNDSLRSWQNKHGHQVAQKNSLEIQNRDQLLALRGLEGTNLRIQNTLKDLKNTITAISHDVETLYDIGTDEVTIIEYRDSMPVYQSSFSTEWIEGTVTMGVDSLNLQQRILNKFDYSVHREKNLFRPDTLQIMATSLNPDTYTQDLSSFNYSLKPKRFSVGPSVSYGIGDNGFGLNIGIGIQYSVIQF